jgi:hypothetical protein
MRIRAWAISCFSLSCLFAVLSFTTQIVAPGQDLSIYLALFVAIFLVGGGNAVVWKFVLARRSVTPAPGQYRVQTAALIVAFAIASIVLVAGILFTGIVVLMFATEMVQ